MYSIGQDVMAFLDALQGGILTRETAVSLLRAEKADLLIGQPEGPWLDVKVDHYDLSGRSGKISLAQAVARFANAEHGGVIVVGMKGKKVPSGEIIKSVHPVPMDARVQRKYELAIQQHLYPPPDYLTVELVPHGYGMLVVVSLPPQPEELKPFLVHGAIVDGSVEGAFISIVRRRGETRFQSLTIDPRDDGRRKGAAATGKGERVRHRLMTASGLHPLLVPPPSPTPIPSAVDPHTVERAWPLASRWSAPLYERPGRQGSRLLGSAWVDGRRDGELPAPATLGRHSPAARPISEPERPRRRHLFDLRVTSTLLPAARSAPPGAASRGADRRQAAPQRRRAPAPCAGLDQVGKVLSR
ncbi:hypothetical protein STENM223S_07037 [Streptomyces tendae]